MLLHDTTCNFLPCYPCLQQDCGDWMQIECICQKRGLLKKGVTSVGNQDILFTHQACGVKFLLTFGTTLPWDLKI
jgi:hypothetical protein